ncbi:alginate O-acetyltransferase AlgX-related protein [Rhodopseudomonas pseudopalustris]|uniref:SGNH hydrolase-like domain-containing protein, acetyltransferase AlgX n=1 Tax=Rhodopseudomonas pseudopalustris TaxID=1513892 RepID=A0A1H8X7K5_9BRAD|nr:alginate O-acetyltransferase [Rhodopseudomonas pseudopalustris]SEP35895.1 SGNH hydrolase-like domain-containing protein, acetyltransferase AlgX [Rhodopseudomonas pseudopalustris]
MAAATTRAGQWLRRLAAAAVLLMPVLTLWNIAVPSRAFNIGPSLIGVTKQTPLDLSLRAFLDGTLQKTAAIRIAEAMPLRRTLIRLNNQIAYSLFGEVNAPGILAGVGGQLVERSYLEEYCTRSDGDADRLADTVVPLLRNLQAYYRDRGAIFLYVVTPSKVAHLPQHFVHLISCRSTDAARVELVPRYVARLRAAGIDVVDAATSTHALKGQYPVELFPRGGIHWNDQAMARASQQIVEAVNRQAGRELLPQFDFTSTVNLPPEGRDRDLAELINLLVSPLDYATPKLTFSNPSCAGQPARTIDAAIVGGSFMDGVGEVLTESACMARLSQYFYLKLGRYGGARRQLIQENLSDSDLQRLRDVDIMLLEENESAIGRQGYLTLLHHIVTDK